MLRELSTKKDVDKAILLNEDKVVALRFGKRDHAATLKLDDLVSLRPTN